MYMNKHARMSTVDRAVELAVRNNVRVPGLAAWDEIARALQARSRAASAETTRCSRSAADAVERRRQRCSRRAMPSRSRDERCAASSTSLEKAKKIPIEKLSVPAKIRLATLGNAFARAMLIRDPIRMVAMAAIKSPGGHRVRGGDATLRNQTLSDDVIRYIASRREWTKHVRNEVRAVPRTRRPR